MWNGDRSRDTALTQCLLHVMVMRSDWVIHYSGMYNQGMLTVVACIWRFELNAWDAAKAKTSKVKVTRSNENCAQ